MESRPCILISACLLGHACRYDGRSKPNEAVTRLKESYRLIPVCPEVCGGLKIPRVPSERQPNGSFLNKAGEDVTANYKKGAAVALALAKKYGCKTAVLKAKSPSCGSSEIYDGSFTGTLIPGEGCTASLLRENGITVLSEDETDSL